MLTSVTTLLTLDRVSEGDESRVGGKALNCARLLQAGFPVPAGLVITSDATDDDVRLLASHPWFGSLPTGMLFAVRSSGIGEDSGGHSFAGIHDTRLNVERRDMVDAVLACRLSARSDQALAYRRARDLPTTGVRIAVLVQPMVAAAVSGVAFTINPITGADELVINAATGLGDALVSGLVDPDEWRVSKSNAAVIASRLGSSREPDGVAVLTVSQLTTLTALLLRIEQHYGTPQDIEWCHDTAQFWIVQARPVTATRVETASSLPVRADTVSQTADPDVEWTRANLAEVLPDQLAPQVLAVYVDMLNRGQAMFMGRLLSPALGPMFKAFRGRMYMNLSQMRRIVSLAGAPAADMLRSLGHPERIHAEDEVAKPASLFERIRCLPDFIRLGLADVRAEQLLRRHEAEMGEFLARLTRLDPSTLSDADIWEQVKWWTNVAPQSIQIVFVMSGVLFRETQIRKICAAVGFPYERLVYPQLAAGQRSVSSQQAFDLVALAGDARREDSAAAYLLANDGRFADYRDQLTGTRFLEKFDRFLDRYGHRGRYESDWSIPRLHENPAPALFAIRERILEDTQDPQSIVDRQQADAAAAWREFEARLATWQRWTLLPWVRSMLRRLKKQYVWREQVRSDLTKILRYARPLHLEMARRFVERGWIERCGDYFLLKLDEIAKAIRDPNEGPGLRAIAARRADELTAERDLRMPLLMRARDLPALLQRPDETPASGASELRGLCVSPGIVVADVVVMRDPSEFATMKRGAILVAPATDPSWTPLFTLASGVIVEVGGMLSHASTIAREYGLPALANVKGATSMLRTGDRVELDASAGCVRIRRE
jgi:pyruvate,water dikinase